jgi:peptide chain release factor 3
VAVAGIGDELVRTTLDPQIYDRVRNDLELLEGAGAGFDRGQVLAGKLTPVFFGSAANNFGVQLLLDQFIKLAPCPLSRTSSGGPIDPDAPFFSGFVFKIQANMNPKHRDHVAFLRIVSGEFKRDMNVNHDRTGKKVRLSNSQRLFAQDRETVDSAWAGDVVGIVGNYDFHVGDTLSEKAGIRFDEIPQFPPECFSFLHNTSTAKYKRFREGLDQLLKEGVAQSFELLDSVQKIPILGAVGPLQFDVLRYRLENEYGAECRFEPANWKVVRWLTPKDPEVRPEFKTSALSLPLQAAAALDGHGRPVILFPNNWSVGYFEDKNPHWSVHSEPPR